MFKMIVAVSADNVLGKKDGGLLWHCPEDLKYFKNQTKGQVVVMGRKTFESLPFEGGLPNRLNIVLSKSLKGSTTPLGAGTSKEHAYICNDVNSLLESLPDFEEHGQSVWVIGGLEIYKLLQPYVKEIHLTRIRGEYLRADAVSFEDNYLEQTLLKNARLTRMTELSENASAFQFNI